ncbi:MAG TPA: transposase [Thermoanaerobaculia bacterium]|nr:transposase [Thermoanaerobaculia bacterium]
MARPLRLEHENAIWHITARGNEQRDIFRDDVDRERFLLLLSQTVIRFGWRLFAWVLMSNHYHLVFQTPQPNLSRGMQWLNGRYAQWFNRRHDRRGHLFQGRFHGALVEKESYLLTVARYVVLNPIRAGMIASPADWRWSSYRQTAGIDVPEPWLAASDLLESFGGATARGCQEYVAFVEQAEQPSPWLDLVGQIYLGSAEWIAEIGERIASAPRSPEHPRPQLEPARPALNDIVNVVAKNFDSTVELLRSGRAQLLTAKSVAAFIAFEDGLHRQSDIAVALSIRGRSSVSAIVRRCRDALGMNDTLRQLVDACRSQLPRGTVSAPLPLPDQISDYGERPWFRSKSRHSS